MTSKVLVFRFAAALSAVAATGSTPATFTKDVLPILQSKCQECHRERKIAPMNFITYGQWPRWVKAIKTAVLRKKMPPWFADPHYGKFSNAMSLSQHEIDTLIAWIDGGAKAGDPKDAPQPRQFADGWQIGQPD